MPRFSILKKIDWLFLGAAIIISILGIIELTQFKTNSGAMVYASRQTVFVVLGILMALGIAYLDYGFFRTYKYGAFVLYGISILLLIALLLTHQVTRGVVSWFRLGPLNFEPAELAKIALIIVLAKYFSLRHVEISRFVHTIVSGAYTAVPIVLIMLQPDLGSAIILAAIWLAVILFSGIKLRHVAILFFVGIIIIVLSWVFVLAPYQKQRITSFIFPTEHVQSGSYNQTQSMIAIGSAGLWGKGLAQDYQAKYGFLPAAHTDFIFASFAESWGMLGIAVLIGLYALLLWRMFVAALRAPNNFSRLFLIGAIASIFVQLFINIGMSLGIMPITGITLPLVSYGGSSVLEEFALIGIAQSIIVRSGV